MTQTLYYNAHVLTQDRANPTASAFMVEHGKITAVGNLSNVENLTTASTRRVDLGGQVVLPGLNDAHVHIWKVGDLLTGMLDVRGVQSIADLQAMIKTRSEQLPDGAWFMGRGYNESLLADGRKPNRHDLDQVVSDRPAYLIRTCAHIVTVNGKALEIAGITADTAPPPGGVIERDEHGEPLGIFHETALGLVFNHIPTPTAQDYETMLSAAMNHQLSLGITSATDPGVMPALMDVYRDMDQRGVLPVRANVMQIRRPDGGTDTLPLPQKHLSNFLRVDTIKFFSDGGLSGATSALNQDYRGQPGYRGVVRFEYDELLALARDAHLEGYRIGTHAIGDAAIDTVMDVYESLYKLGKGQRHRIEHFGLPTADHCHRAAQAGIIAVPQTIFIHELGGNFRASLPDDLLPRCYPVRMMLEHDVTVALSSDAPVVKDDNPFLGMQAAILRHDVAGGSVALEQAITIEQALYGYTMGGAIASGDVDNRGSISVGKWADFIVIDRNPLEIEAEQLTDIQVLQTVIGGETRYEI